MAWDRHTNVVGLNRLMESHSCWNDSDAYLILSWFCLLSHVIPIDFLYWFDYLAYIYFDYQVIPKVNIDISPRHYILQKKQHIPRGIKLKRYAKFYYNDMISRNKNKGGYDVKRRFQPTNGRKLELHLLDYGRNCLHLSH